jgi:(p)ppGpp synthase/HD superfamily hydrolase
MTPEQTQQLSGTRLAPYIQVATCLIGKSREGGGNMFRHQLDTMSILIDYGYIDPVLLKAAIVHDVLEDIPDFNHNILLNIDIDSHDVYELVKEVSRCQGETKADFLPVSGKQAHTMQKFLKWRIASQT